MGCRFLTFVAIVAFIAGCTSSNGSPTPSPTPHPTSSTNSSPSPEPSQSEPLTTGPNVRPGEKPPVYPELARKHTAQGALAFAYYYYEAFDWGYATNDPYLLRRISTPECAACRKYVSRLRNLQQSGGILLGGRIHVLARGLRSGNFGIHSDYVAQVAVSQTAIILDRPNAAPSTAAAALNRYSQLIFISWRKGGWRVVEVTGA